MKSAGDLYDKGYEMNLPGIKLIPFKTVRPGTAAFRTVDVFPHAFASRKALRIINSNPELLISYFAYRYGQQIATHQAPYSKTVELATAKTSVYAVIEDNTALIKIEDYSPVRFYSPQECPSLKIHDRVDVPPYPHAGRAIAISSRMDSALIALDDMLFGERKLEANRPTFVPSIPLRVYEWLFRISEMHGLKDRDFLDLGSGFGTVVFLASLFCRSAAGVEIHSDLHACAVGIESGLRKDGVIDAPVSLMCDDFTGDFDITPYSFVYVYKPYFAKPDKMLQKLRETRPGTLILADLVPQILYDESFIRLKYLSRNCLSDTAFLLARK